MYIKKQYIISLIIIVMIAIVVGLVINLDLDKEQPYNGSMVGKYVYKSKAYTNVVELYNNGTCKFYYENEYLNYTNCTYVRQGQEVVLSYYCISTEKDVEISFKITSNGDLNGILDSIYYRQ